MSHYSKVFNKVPVQIKNRSGYDESHENLWTGSVGTLVPTFWDWLRPGDTVSLGTLANVSMPPMATDWYGKCDFHTEFFAVPCRVLWAGFQKFVSHINGAGNAISSATGGESQITKALPNFSIDGAYLGAGTLADYFGFKVANPVEGTTYTIKNGMPMLAYNKIWEDWFRQPNVMKPAFAEPYINAATNVGALPYTILGASSSNANNFSGDNLLCFDGTAVYALRQRCFSKDYFTNSSLRPQASDSPASVAFTVSSNAGTISIPAIRAANSLQQFLERQNLMGISSTYNGNEAYYNTIIGQFGVKPSDYAMGRAIYLGRTVANVYNRSVFQSTDGTSSEASLSQNPFLSVGAKYANSQAVGQGSLCDRFTASEDMIIMAISSLVPHQYYGTGIDRKLMMSSPSDLPWPLLSGIGDQAIYNYELNGNASDTTIFGYTGYMDHFKFKDDQVHGLFRDGESLEAFVLQTSFDITDSPSLGSDFLEIPTTYMDNVTAVSSELSTFGYWVDQYFTYKKTSQLPVYSIPTLEDVKDTHTEVVDKNGKRL